jgi:hypothetical protein
MANDEDTRPDTWTRSALLAQRGYPPEVINGHNGNGAASAATSSPSRTCRGCGKPITGRVTKIYCGDVCASAARRADARRRGATITASAPVSPSTVTNGTRMDDNPSPICDRTGADQSRADLSNPNLGAVDLAAVTAPVDGRDRLGPIYGALMLAGASLVRVDVLVGGEYWTVTRSSGIGTNSTTNGGNP